MTGIWHSKKLRKLRSAFRSVMRRPNAWKRAAPVLKTVVVVTAVLVFTHAVVQIHAAGLVVALVLGLLVVVALSLENRILMAVAGVGFLLAAGAHLLCWRPTTAGSSAVTGRRSPCGSRGVSG